MAPRWDTLGGYPDTCSAGTYGGLVSAVSNPDVTAWNVDLGHFDLCLGTWAERVSFGAAIVQKPFFIRQDDSTIPMQGDDAALMVSKRPPDVNLEESVDFTSPFTGLDADPDTFRPQIAGIEAGHDVAFRVQVLRDGQTTYEHEFESVFGTLADDGGPAYRGARHLRLVSNGRPPEMEPFPEAAQYDDEHLAEQTILIKLGDAVRVTVVVDGTDLDYAELPVGRPATESGLKAVRNGYLHFIELPGLSHTLPPQPETTVERVNDDWAQIAIRFDLAGTSSIEPVSNILTVDLPGETAGVNGSVNLTVTPDGSAPTAVSIDVFAGDAPGQIAGRLAQVISAVVPGITAEPFPHRVANDDFWLVLMNRGNAVAFDLTGKYERCERRRARVRLR